MALEYRQIQINYTIHWVLSNDKRWRYKLAMKFPTFSRWHRSSRTLTPTAYPASSNLIMLNNCLSSYNSGAFVFTKKPKWKKQHIYFRKALSAIAASNNWQVLLLLWMCFPLWGIQRLFSYILVRNKWTIALTGQPCFLGSTNSNK